MKTPVLPTTVIRWVLATEGDNNYFLKVDYVDLYTYNKWALSYVYITTVAKNIAVDRFSIGGVSDLDPIFPNPK